LKPLALLALVTSCATAWAAPAAPEPVPCQVFFSPRGGCQEAVVGTLAAARKTVLVQAYYLTSAPIAEALKQAHARGVLVRVILDRSQSSERYTGLTFLRHAGIQVWVDRAHAIAHNKVMVIDGATVITGSFNFTKAAEEKNAENLLILRDEALARRYAENWNLHRAHSEGQSDPAAFSPGPGKDPWP
jgi:phosphatidylserine/phosphatidylglycerophosphate/cardiolipin synthase-like enzyme